MKIDFAFRLAQLYLYRSWQMLQTGRCRGPPWNAVVFDRRHMSMNGFWSAPRRLTVSPVAMQYRWGCVCWYAIEYFMCFMWSECVHMCLQMAWKFIVFFFSNECLPGVDTYIDGSSIQLSRLLIGIFIGRCIDSIIFIRFSRFWYLNLSSTDILLMRW